MKIALYVTSALFSATTAQAKIAEAPSTVNARYVEASAANLLRPSEKVSNLYARNMTQPYVLQRLTQRTFWFQKQFYSTTFYVGDRGVLLFDPLETRAGDILKAIAQATPLPVTAIVYSHDHADHIGDTPALLAALKECGVKPRIIATKATADKMQRLRSKLPRPDAIIAWPNGQFRFENLTVLARGFVHAAHTDDHAAWLLKEERVLHLPDLINPDQPPFWRFAGAEHFGDYETNLAQVSALDWQYLNAGHGNIGSRDDLKFYAKYLKDLKTAVAKALETTEFGTGVDANMINAHTALLPAWLSAVGAKATDTLRPEYGHFYGFDAATPSNAEMVALDMYSYR